jgi:hypothetical protein
MLPKKSCKVCNSPACFTGSHVRDYKQAKKFYYCSYHLSGYFFFLTNFFLNFNKIFLHFYKERNLVSFIDYLLQACNVLNCIFSLEHKAKLYRIILYIN